jgi:hypothetical protein
MLIPSTSYDQLRSISSPTLAAPDNSPSASPAQQAPDSGRSQSDSVQFSDAALSMAAQIYTQSDSDTDA